MLSGNIARGERFCGLAQHTQNNPTHLPRLLQSFGSRNARGLIASST